MCDHTHTRQRLSHCMRKAPLSSNHPNIHSSHINKGTQPYLVLSTHPPLMQCACAMIDEQTQPPLNRNLAELSHTNTTMYLPGTNSLPTSTKQPLPVDLPMLLQKALCTRCVETNRHHPAHLCTCTTCLSTHQQSASAGPQNPDAASQARPAS